jgi:uncharacterized OB-fold protein
MTTQTQPKPRPVPDEMSAQYWEATGHGELAIQQCDHCGHYSHPPTPVCGSCFGMPPAFTFRPVSGTGRIVTWTVMRQAFLPGFTDDVPFVVVVVELDEQPDLVLTGRLVDGPDATIILGDRVTVRFDQLPSGEKIPAFALTTGDGNQEATR